MKNIVVVDFDGCLCSVNSFRLWLLFSPLYLLLSLHWISLFVFVKCIVLRILGKADRVQMKQGVLRVTESLPPYYIVWFCRFLKLFVNHDVLSEMNKYENAGIVLCTAAPAFYVKIFAQNLNFSEVFATPSVYESDWKENIGRVKLETLEAFYGEGVVISCVITDHHDDLPLLLSAERRVLVRPSSVTLTKITGKFEFETL